MVFRKVDSAMHLPKRIQLTGAFSILLAVAAGVATLSLCSSQAVAFVQTTTCTEGGPYPCDHNETPKPVYWPRSCVSFHINRDGSAKVAGETAGLSEELEGVVVEAFARWAGVECSRLQLVYAGRTGNAAAEVTDDPERNMNLVVWHDESWPHGSSAMALAITSVTFDSRNGKIVDADVELNTTAHEFSTTTPPKPNHTDLLNTLVHEVGHFIGLDHTPETEATMYASASEGETHKRSLEQDDIDGICHIYPADDAPVECTPDKGSNNTDAGSSDTSESTSTSSGCGCASADSPTPGFWLVALFVAMWGALAASRRRRPRRG